MKCNYSYRGVECVRVRAIVGDGVMTVLFCVHLCIVVERVLSIVLAYIIRFGVLIFVLCMETS